MDLQYIRTKQGVSDVTDNQTTRFAEEIYCNSRLIASSWRRDCLSSVKENELFREEFHPDILWSVSFAESMKEIVEECGSNLIKIGREVSRKYFLFDCGIYSKLYSRFAGPITIPRLQAFIDSSRDALQNAMLSGKTAVVSRVLETDVNYAFSSIVFGLQRAAKLGLRSNCMFFLSPNDDPDFGLVKIGHEEAKRLNENPGKKANLKKDRGISWVPDINALRHVRVHARTVAGLFFLSKAFPQNVRVFFRRQIPDARSSIILDNGKILQAFQVGTEGYDIGLDSAFYEVLDPFDANRLYLRTTDEQKRIERSSDNLLSDLKISERIESQIVENNHWTDIENKIAALHGFSFQNWVENNTEKSVTSYTISQLLENMEGAEAKWKTAEKIEFIFELLSKEQRLIDNEFMPHLRLEKEKGLESADAF